MQIIKKLIIRNRLKKEVESIDDFLNENDYYKMDLELYSLRFHSAEYACLYDEIEKSFRPSLDRKHKLQQQIQRLSGKNLFVKMNLEEFSKYKSFQIKTAKSAVFSFALLSKYFP